MPRKPEAPAAATPEWRARPERSNAFALSAMRWAALNLGRPVARLLLLPITAWFLATVPSARRASRAYLDRALGRPATLLDVARHFHAFASVTLDRVWFLTGRHDLFQVEVQGEAVARTVAAAGTGCFLLGAHYGSFESVRAWGLRQPGVRVSLLMYEDNARRIGAALRALDPGLDLTIIALGRVDSMLKLREALEAGQWVGMLGDRALGDDDTVELPFLGRPARFPLGPFRLARMLRRPVVLMCGAWLGGNRYRVRFEAMPEDLSPEAAAAHYAARLEAWCREAPLNGFNFHDVWA